MSKILSKNVVTSDYTLECILLPREPENAKDERTLVITLIDTFRGEKKSPITSVVDISVKDAMSRHKDIVIKMNYCKMGVEVTCETSVLNNNLREDYLLILARVHLNYTFDGNKREMGNTELLFMAPNPHYTNVDYEKSVTELLLDHARLTRLKDTYLDSDASLDEKVEFIKIFDSSTYIMDKLLGMSDSDLYTTDDNIRITRERRRLEGLLTPDESCYHDCMGSSWLSRPNEDIDFQKWENSGRIAIHAIKLG